MVICMAKCAEKCVVNGISVCGMQAGLPCCSLFKLARGAEAVAWGLDVERSLKMSLKHKSCGGFLPRFLPLSVIVAGLKPTLGLQMLAQV